jgi:hypothetical protein
MHYAKTAHRLREHIIKFSGELSAGMPKVARRFITEAIYGIQARQSVRLTEIARSLGEEISIKKTQYRLSLTDVNYFFPPHCLNRECYPKICILSRPIALAFSDESGSLIPA